MPAYIKFLRDGLTHNGLTYKVGINVDPIPFVGSGSCSAGGIYFSELSHWTEWTHMGTNAALVLIPDDAQVYREPCGTKLKADKIEIVKIVDMMEGGWIQNLFKDFPNFLLDLVSSGGEVIRYVKDQSPELCLAAVTQCGDAIKYVNEQTPEICLAAVISSGWTLNYVKEQTPEICLAAVTSIGHSLEYVKEQTPEICLAAVTSRGYALEFVQEQTPEICLAAVTSSGR